MKLLHVDASAKGERSNSRALSKYFVNSLREKNSDLEVDYLDLIVDTPPHVTEEFAIAIYTPSKDRTSEMNKLLAYSDKLCARLFAADAFVFAMPMYNWTVPSTFKAFIDNVTRGELTFKYVDGKAVGQLSRQKTLIITARGADLRPGNVYSSMDALTPVLKTTLGFIGMHDPIFVDAQPLQFAEPILRAEALERAHKDLDRVVDLWSNSQV